MRKKNFLQHKQPTKFMDNKPNLQKIQEIFIQLEKMDDHSRETVEGNKKPLLLKYKTQLKT